MENSGFVRNKFLKLPPGFRFHPTDEELVVHYLKKKVLDHPLPARIILEFDVCNCDPWDLPGEAEQIKYFFSTREAKYHSGNRSNRATISGNWKATGIDKSIVSSKYNRVVGLKKTLVFYRGKPPHCSKTNWIMHEYRLPSAETSPKVSSEARIGDWVICRIFYKGREENKSTNIAEKRKRSSPVFIDFLKEDNTKLSLCSSSELSEITEVSGRNESEDSDVNSCGSFLRFRGTLV